MVIFRNIGTTPSESRLAKLADRTFLDLWSYPNAYIDKKQHSSGAGKEFCDLLVVCGDDIIIFSDKNVRWPVANSIDTSWARWFRKAVSAAVTQINGAVRWIKEFPDRIFLDAKCEHKLPIKLPPPERRRIHGIVVSNGSNVACKQHFGDVSGTLVINPNLKGFDHIDTANDLYSPFSIGDVNPDGPFVHVFDTQALLVVLTELDTITDFVNYINRRAKLIRSGRLLIASGEEDLLAQYLFYTTRSGEHDFLVGNNRRIPKRAQLVIKGGQYLSLLKNPAHHAKKQANRESYYWDRLISSFTRHMIDGTNVALYPDQQLGIHAEPALRLMALENRTARRMLGHHLRSSFLTAQERRQDRFNRTIFPIDYKEGVNVAYVILILAYKPEMFENRGGYEEYRRARANFLEALCMSVAYEYRRISHVVAIGFDASPDITGIEISSEDLVGIEAPVWTEEAERNVLQRREEMGIKDPRELQMMRSSTKEYPNEQMVSTGKLSRQERRSLEREKKKQYRRRSEPSDYWR